MAEFPNASPMGLFPQSVEQPEIKPTIVIVHTYVGNPSLASNLAAMEPLSFTGEHHFYMRVGGDELAQFLSTTTRADNNFRANSFMANGTRCGAISIETGDEFNDGDRDLEKSWTDLQQFDALVELVAWCCETHDIPVRRCPSPTEPGIGYHSMWGYNEWGSGEGTYGHIVNDKGRRIRLNNPWTNIVGKTCPGPGKTAEFPQLLDAVALRVGVASPVEPTDDDATDATMRAVPWTGELRASAAVTLQGRAVQWRLSVLGFPPVGGVDGNYGTKSAAACRQFQAAKGLPVTGVVDMATWRALGLREPGEPQPARTTVRPGEGWIAIARRTIGADRWREIRDLNGGADRVLQPGDVIELPS